MKSSAFNLFILGMSSFLFFGCDQPLKNNANPEGEIVWVGNGMQSYSLGPIDQGIVLNLMGKDGKVSSQLVIAKGPQALVTDGNKNEVPAELGWVAHGQMDEPVMQFDLKNSDIPCKFYESLPDGKLLCRHDLDQLDARANFQPIFLSSGEVLFVDSSDHLNSLKNKEVTPLVASVGAVLADRSDQIFYQTKEDLIWRHYLLSTPNTPSERVSSAPLLDMSLNYIFIGGDGALYFYVDMDTNDLKARSLYRYPLATDKVQLIQKVAELPEDLSLREISNDKTLVDSHELVVKAYKTPLDPLSEESVTEVFVKISSDGFDVLTPESPLKPSAEKSTASAIEDSANPQKSKSSNKVTMDAVLIQNADVGKQSLELCQKTGSGTAETDVQKDPATDQTSRSSLLSKDAQMRECENLLLPDSFQVKEAILGPKKLIFVSGVLLETVVETPVQGTAKDSNDEITMNSTEKQANDPSTDPENSSSSLVKSSPDLLLVYQYGLSKTPDQNVNTVTAMEAAPSESDLESAKTSDIQLIGQHSFDSAISHLRFISKTEQTKDSQPNKNSNQATASTDSSGLN